MANADGLLEELFWRSPEWADQMGGVHENTVLFYFAKSPFFEATSNNAVLETQALYNLETSEAISTRLSFEARLDGMSGLEYRVHLGPMDYGPEAWPNMGRWVIRKQNRRIDYDNDRTEIQVLATYFIVGISVYLAPSVSELMTTRLLSTTSSLSRLMQKASSLALYSPGLGHHYMPSNLKQKDKADRTPAQSREVSMAPEEGSQLSESAKKARAQGSDLGTLIGAYQQFNNYGNEYMDENPLQGEPGSFVFSNSKEHVQARREAEAKRVQQQTEMKLAQDEAKKAAAAMSRAQSEVPKAETPASKPEKVATPSRKGSRAPQDGDADKARKPKKRKTTAKTPLAPGTPLAVPG